MICNKRDALFENYRQLVERLSESVIGLRSGQHSAAFDAMYQGTEDIRDKCDAARRALEDRARVVSFRQVIHTVSIVDGF